MVNRNQFQLGKMNGSFEYDMGYDNFVWLQAHNI